LVILTFLPLATSELSISFLHYC